MKPPKEPIVTLGGADKNGYCPVRIRLTFKKREDFYTGITVKQNQWDENTHRVKQGCKVKGVSYAALNKIINERLKFITDYVDSAVLRMDEYASATALKELYHAKFMRSEREQSEEFFVLLEQYIEKQNGSKHWSDKYKEQWDRFYKDLKEFRPSLKFTDLSEEFMMSYVKHLSKRMSDEKIKEYLKKFKEFVKSTEKNNIPVHKDFYTYKPSTQKRNKEVNYLRIEELQKIIRLDYRTKPRLDRTRDVFVFQCCTSLRFSDVSALTRNNVREGDDSRLEVLLVTRKDKGKVWFPLPQLAERIYKKYEEFEYDNNKAFHVPCGTDFRRYLKEIGEDAELEGETISYRYSQGKEIVERKPRTHLGTHDARRTFIVHALNGGATFEKIALFTSHSEVEQMKPYITLTQQGKEDVKNIIDNITEIEEEE
ncbi:MAG: site-specific integrase [Bacteroidales bacterium]|nr:site-specific integrase [Bacteroidales bacterium]